MRAARGVRAQDAADPPAADEEADREFASALLVRLAAQELAARGAAAFGPTLGEATVALAPKRALLAAVAHARGLAPLLAVGRGLGRLRAELPADPVLRALLRAADPRDAFARWQRLERFLHSRHRLEVSDLPTAAAVGGTGATMGAPTGGPAGGAVLVRHVGPPGAPPGAAEDALILGVMAELCREAGAVGLTVTLVGPGGA